MTLISLIKPSILHKYYNLCRCIPHASLRRTLMSRVKDGGKERMEKGENLHQNSTDFHRICTQKEIVEIRRSIMFCAFIYKGLSRFWGGGEKVENLLQEKGILRRLGANLRNSILMRKSPRTLYQHSRAFWSGGERGIRTPERWNRMDLQSTPFSHLDISPKRKCHHAPIGKAAQAFFEKYF